MSGSAPHHPEHIASRAHRGRKRRRAKNVIAPLESRRRVCDRLFVEPIDRPDSIAANTLTSWIRSTAPDRPEPLTHLKLQKLAYYCYGALLAFDCEETVGFLEFEAWKHGPVSPAIYELFKEYANASIGRAPKPFIASSAEAHLYDVMNVFGRMSAWQLREESHLTNTPWRKSYDGVRGRVISPDVMRSHFRQMFTSPVSLPERLFGCSSMQLDRIPVPTFASLREMSQAVTRIFGDAV
jgi:uncharacterized phage-associated protein